MHLNPHPVSKDPSVLLLSMPWTTLSEPGPGLGILKAVLSAKAIPCQILRANLYLLEHLQASTYEALSVVYALNDFLFSAVLDPQVTHEQHRWLRYKVRELLSDNVIGSGRMGGSEGVVRTMLELRQEILPQWLAGWADRVAEHPATLVGFTCMFDQTVSSLALAKLIREKSPEKMIAFGGVAARTPTAQMLLRSNPWVDAICDGDGEETIIPLAKASAGLLPLTRVPGIVCRSESGEPMSTLAPSPVDMNQVPTPDYDDYFQDLKTLQQEYKITISPISLPLENSRGCWWGQKSHCVFCGIRDEDLAYRAKDHQNVLESMKALSERYQMSSFRFSDYILPIKYYDTLLPELIQKGSPYQLSSEMKANITEPRFQILADAGFHEVQLGIESFSTKVLTTMSKGVSASQNVYSLMLGKKMGIRILYNILYGFPNEDLEEYRLMVAQLANLVHLDPPVSTVPVQITRFAPMQTNPQRFGITSGDPAPSYALILSEEYRQKSGFDMRDFCYYFERTYENAPKLERLYDQINEITQQWKKAIMHSPRTLTREVEETEWLIRDNRWEVQKSYRLDSEYARILAACTIPTHRNELVSEGESYESLDQKLQGLMKLGLVFLDGDKAVSLVMDALPPEVNRPSPVRPNEQLFQKLTGAYASQ